MTPTTVNDGTWPALPFEAWRETCETVHMWTQVAGKICLATTPRTNHFWNITFQVTPRGLSTPSMMAGNRAFTMTFDFVAHRLVIQCSDGGTDTIPLEPQTVADFYRRVMEVLHRLGIDARIWTMPVEIPNPIRFDLDVTQGPTIRLPSTPSGATRDQARVREFPVRLRWQVQPSALLLG